MTNASRWALVLALITLLVAAPGAGATDDLTVAIEIAPNVVNLASSGVWVTVHADIALSDVDCDGLDVTLNGVSVEIVKADNHGDLVAKFAVDGVKALLDDTVGESVDLVLQGGTVYGTFFHGTGTIRVVEVKGNK